VDLESKMPLKKAIVAMLASTFLLSGSVIPAAAQRGGQCEELRAACESKRQLGEQGEGNCQRYRQMCQPQQSRQQMCQELRAACMHKGQLGEQGEGNCRKYRETCRR
jgi:hypothetical protein